MPEPVWSRSLYWRIALGFVALLAALLVVQGLVFLWMTGRMADLFPNRTAAQLAATLATDASTVLAAKPDTDMRAYVNDKYSRSSHGFVIWFDDGRPPAVSLRVPPPPYLLRMTESRLFETKNPGARFSERRGRGRGFGGPPPDGLPARAPGAPSGREGLGFGFGFGRTFTGEQDVEFADVRVNGLLVGMAAVPLEPAPLSLAVRDLGPTLAAVALVLLAMGTAVSALLIFRPAGRRLRELADATRAIGAGETGVRAPETGGDEVSSLARAFNEMAGQLEQRTIALENANRIRRQLLADVSHELNTPLAAVRGYVETLTMDGITLDEGTRRRYLNIVNEETVRLEHIIGDLLELARLEGGGGAFRVEPVAIDQLLARVRRRHEQNLAERRLMLVTERDPAIPNVNGDANRLEQALQNLVANAIRHTPAGGTVAVRVSRAGDMIVMRVEDTGPGIPPEHLARVFDRFYKADESRTGTDTPSGSGLGLSIVRAIVTRHGGTIGVSNVPGAGARFEIRLPLTAADVA